MSRPSAEKSNRRRLKRMNKRRAQYANRRAGRTREGDDFSKQGLCCKRPH